MAVAIERPSAVAAVEVSGLARRFGARWVLRGARLRIDAGRIVALTGPNGSGKTTLLRILATLLPPTRGSVRIFGVDVAADGDALRRRLGFLAHAPGLYDDLTADENLRFAQRMSGLATDATQRRAVLERVGLADAAHDRARGFSAGMRRRLALGRILLRPPSFLLLDEPYASFDAGGIALVNEIARETAADGGVVIIATHDLDRAAAVMDERFEIEAGVIVARAVSGLR
jgi:heme exporter protein A